jgi:hypothetical protein
MSFLTSDEFPYPTPLMGALVPDSAFAAAYEEVSAVQRGLLKRCIAQLFSWYGRSTELVESAAVRHGSGLHSFSMSRPLDWTVLVMDGGGHSPVQFLAALLVPLLSGVDHVSVVRDVVDTPWDPAVLTAAELAGVETVFSSPDRTLLPTLVQDLSKKYLHGRVVSLGGGSLSRETFALAQAGGVLHTALQPVRRIGIWSEGSGSWDLQSLRFGQPYAEIVRCGAPDREESSSSCLNMSWPEFLDMDFKAVLVPAERIDTALERVPLVLGPGQESFWIWPRLTLETFRARSAGFGDTLAERFESV